MLPVASTATPTGLYKHPSQPAPRVPNLRRKVPWLSKMLDAGVVVLGDDDVAGGVYGHTVGVVELPVATAVAAELEEKVPLAVKDLDAMVVAVGHIDVAGGVKGHTKGKGELPVATAEAAELEGIGIALCLRL